MVSRPKAVFILGICFRKFIDDFYDSLGQLLADYSDSDNLSCLDWIIS